MIFEDVFDNPAFWMLAGGGIAAVLLGNKFGQQMGQGFPWWQLLIIIVVIIIASAFFASQE